MSCPYHPDKFHDSPASNEFRAYFSDLSFRLSGKAIVMDYYPMSLKDLLERGWPEASTPQRESKAGGPPDDAESEAIGRGAGGKFGEKSGYSILRSLSQVEREKCILPIVQDVAEGLSILHSPGYRHQDIKPANVLIRQIGPNLQAALADLGFIESGTSQVHGSAAQHRPIGTRHYRSPEQTDSYDVCEVDIMESEGDSHILHTSDPKFLNTFSEVGDFVVFAKLEDPIQWEIIGLEFPKKNGELDISSEPVIIKVKKLEGVPLKPDERTQIAVHKKQTVRTDLFGLGAIIYDMLTCGKSPEQFYDLLRAHDRPSEAIDSGLARRYLHFRNGGGAVPEVDSVFQSLRVDVGSEFPSQDLVMIILRCMMSRPKDSYYDGTNHDEIWKRVREDLSKLSASLPGAASYRLVGDNYLTSPAKAVRQPAEKESETPTSSLRSLQGLSYDKSEEFAQRIVRGANFFAEIADMIERELRGGSDFSYLVDVSPTNLERRKGMYHPKYAFFEREEDLEALLTMGNPRTVRQTFSAGNLLPPFMRGLVRDCEVWTDGHGQGNAQAGDGNGKEQRRRLFFDPWGPDNGWPSFHAGDRLSIELSPTEKPNAIIESEIEGKISVDVAHDAHGAKVDLYRRMDPWKRYRGALFRRFLPSDYYISMLGIYVRLIFFVNPLDRREGIPKAAFCPGTEFRLRLDAKAANASRFAKLVRIPRREPSFAGRSDSMFQYLARLYLRLVTRSVLLESESQGAKNAIDKNLFSYPVQDAAAVVSRLVSEFSTELAKLAGEESQKVVLPEGEELILKIKSQYSGKIAFPNIHQLTQELIESG